MEQFIELGFETIYLKKRFPLRISRGVEEGSENLFVSLTRDRLTGWGEMSPGATEGAESAAFGQQQLEDFWQQLPPNCSIHERYDLAREAGVAPCALAALDMAHWDLLGKKAAMPLHRLLGLPLPKTPTSVTIGINPSEVIKERIPLLLNGTGVRSLKIKLGAREGIEADKAMFAQVRESARPYNVSLRVDANGGWAVNEAKAMMAWLAERGVAYVEQPLTEGREADLKYLFTDRPLPIYIDESCRFASDVVRFGKYVDGVNLKLMKCGGITEAIRILATARAMGLKTMIGCMGESSIAISSGAAISGIIDHIDLDSHLNLAPDPASGATLKNGIITPNGKNGHGANFTIYDTRK